MPLSAGDRLGPHEILAPIGAGGMGEVYRAKDTTLGREVAIKVLPRAVAQNPERLARFRREAQLLASLNHPNIGQIYGVESQALVMELVEGATLKGPLPVETALDYARQIAEAIGAAHEKGIIHRDLKPSNIMVTPAGLVKVLDFGLAKAVEPSAAGDDLANSPTATLSATRQGVLLGTAGYMSPEQARGAPVDKRADIWAFGVVLYEMLTGQRLFKGPTVTDTIAAVLTKEPDWNLVPPKTERLLRRCLERDLKHRLRDIGDARFLLEDDPRNDIPASKNNLAWKIGTAALTIVLGSVLWYLWASTRHSTPTLLRLTIDLGESAALTPIRGTSMAISPDGSRIVFIMGQLIVKPQLAMRRLDQSKAVPLAGTDGAEAPFFSPDGKSIGFFADGKLKKMDADGGAPVTLCDAPSHREGSWGDDGTIVFAATNHDGLSRVASSGGTPQPVTALDQKRSESTHRYPQMLPGSHAALFMNDVDAAGEGAVEVVSLKTGKRKPLIQAGGYGHYLPSGHLVYMHGGTLFAAPMDVGRLELTGPSVPILEDVSFYAGTGTGGFTFSQSGLFVYVAVTPEDQMRPIGLLDEKGKLEVLPVAKARYGRPRISPDGSRLAVAIRDGAASHIWIYELGSRQFSRFAFPNGNSANPVWAPDGKYLVFSTDAQNPGPGIYWMRADGVGAPQRLVEGPRLVPASFSSSSGSTPARLVYEVEAGQNTGLWMLPLDSDDAARAKPGVPERFPGPPMESPAAFSPDGRWIAYNTGQSGTPEILVRPFPGPGGPWQVSNGGGNQLFWSQKRRELFYLGKPVPRVMVSSYSVSGGSFSPGRPRPWSETRVESFDLMPDGMHVVAIPAAVQKVATQATVLLGFMEDLRRKAPPGR